WACAESKADDFGPHRPCDSIVVWAEMDRRCRRAGSIDPTSSRVVDLTVHLEQSWAMARLPDSPVHRRCFAAAAHSQFAKETVDVVLDRRHRHAELLGDLLVGESFVHGAQHSLLGGGETV